MNQASLATTVLAISLLASGVHADLVVTFDDLPLDGPDSFWNGSDGSGGFLSGGVHFANLYDDTFDVWSGFAYSNVDAPEAGGFENQYAVFHPGTDRGGDGIYAVGFYVEESIFAAEFRPRFTLSDPAEVLDLYVNNTAYTALSIRDGDGFTDPFDDGDWYRLHIHGLDEALDPVGSEVVVYLADYRDGNTFIMDEWTLVNVASAFGGSVKHVEFRVEGSKEGDFGLDTPAYFALDDIRIIPEPGVLGFLLTGLAGLAVLRRRRG